MLWFNRIFGVFAIMASTAFASFADLPVVNLQGKSFYYYDVQKGESLYGIAKANGWDVDILRELNPVVSIDPKKGTRLYYPVLTDDSHIEKEIKSHQIVPQSKVIHHYVEKGDNVYSIAKKYSVPVDLIYYQNPSSRLGIKIGETLSIDPTIPVDAPVNYVINYGDTPYSISKKFNCSVEDIYRENPGVSDKNFKSGHTIKVPVNSNRHRIRNEIVKEEQLESFTTYKVGKEESWEGIANKIGTPTVDLQASNQDKILKKGTILSIPKYNEVEVVKQYVETDPRESSPEGREQIYQDVQFQLSQNPQQIRAVIVLESPESNKDLEFCRGFLTAVDQYKKEGFEITLSIIKGNRPQEEVMEDIMRIKPNLIFPTTDKLTPEYLAGYAYTHNAHLINSLDLKSNLVDANEMIVQCMPSSGLFNDIVTNYILTHFANRKIILVGDNNEDDSLATQLLSRLSSSQVLSLSPEEVKDYPFYNTDSYLVYSSQTKKADVIDLLEHLDKVRQESPNIEMSVVGRPNWITLADGMKEIFFRNDVYIPSRFYFDTNEPDSKKFLAAFKTLFNHPPLKSFPVYAAIGFDIANYFLPLQAYDSNDFLKKPVTAFPQLQVGVNLKKISLNGGYVNPVCYFLHYSPVEYVDKIRID